MPIQSWRHCMALFRWDTGTGCCIYRLPICINTKIYRIESYQSTDIIDSKHAPGIPLGNQHLIRCPILKHGICHGQILTHLLARLGDFRIICHFARIQHGIFKTTCPRKTILQREINWRDIHEHKGPTTGFLNVLLISLTRPGTCCGFLTRSTIPVARIWDQHRYCGVEGLPNSWSIHLCERDIFRT